MSENGFDWKHDVRPARGLWAPGLYIANCTKCREQFIGAKRAMECADCAYARPDAPEAEPTRPMSEEAEKMAVLCSKLTNNRLGQR